MQLVDKMQLNPISRSKAVCQLCRFHLTQKRSQARQFQAFAARFRTQPNRTPKSLCTVSKCIQPQWSRQRASRITIQRWQSTNPHVSAGNIAISVKEVRQETDNLLKQEEVPSEGEILAVLEKLQKLADGLSMKETTPESRDANRDGTPASALLSLDGKPVSSMSLKQTVELISNLAHRIVRHPTVFITPTILNTYTNIQLRLHRPSLLPEIFDLYASKPIPQPNTHPIQYQPSQLHAPANAIPVPLATRALTAAITAKDLPTALSLIETSYRAPAYRRAKALKSAAPAVLACGLTPIASYATATHLSAFLGLNDGASSTGVFAAGLLTYAGVVAAMGYVALTTANDQMRRVTWTDGTALWARWVREEERAAADAVALAWGFRGRERWGEEEGPEWEFLREWIGERGMVLDRVSLMEGME